MTLTNLSPVEIAAPEPPRVEPGTPYHRLGRTPVHRWWRPVLGTVLVGLGAGTSMCLLSAGWYGAAALAGRPAGPEGLPSFGALSDLVLGLLVLASITPFVLLAARATQRRPAGSVSSVLGRLRWRWLGACLLVAVPAVLLMLAGAVGLFLLTGEPVTEEGDGWVGVGAFVVPVLLLLMVVPFQAAAEEYLCRGWLLQAVGSLMRTPWPAIVLQALVFAALHGLGTWVGFVDLVAFGVVLGWLAVRTGGIEAGIALHVANNVLALMFAAAFGQLDAIQTAADSVWQLTVANVVMFAGYAAVIQWLAKRRELAVTAP